MELFNNVKRERLISIASNYVDDIIEDRGNNIEDLASAFSNAGFTKSEFIQVLDDIYLDSYHWAEEDTEEEEAVEKVNAKIEEVSVGDSDQAILETALTQIGIPYTWEKSNDDDGGWIDLKIVDEGEPTESTAAEIYFTKEGKFSGLY